MNGEENLEIYGGVDGIYGNENVFTRPQWTMALKGLDLSDLIDDWPFSYDRKLASSTRRSQEKNVTSHAPLFSIAIRGSVKILKLLLYDKTANKVNTRRGPAQLADLHGTPNHSRTTQKH